jgi:copper oxidase (laccase) domain-containing protein
MNFKVEDHDLGRDYSCFDSSVGIAFRGTRFGSVDFMDPEYAAQLFRLRAHTGVQGIVQMYSAFTHKVISLGDSKSIVERADKSVFTTEEPCDGLVVSADVNLATVQTNGDCPTIVLHRPDGKIANLHGGLRCLENGNNTSIVSQAIEAMAQGVFAVEDLRAFVLAGANKCCFGHLSHDKATQHVNEESARRITNKFGNDVVGVVENAPRAGGISYDMFSIIRILLEQAGVRDSNIDMDNRCTSCEGLSVADMSTPGAQGMWFSNLRQNTPEIPKNRNAVLVYTRNMEG